MKFCPECSNMLYVDFELDEQNNLNQSCKNCGYTQKNLLIILLTVNSIL